MQYLNFGAVNDAVKIWLPALYNQNVIDSRISDFCDF